MDGAQIGALIGGVVVVVAVVIIRLRRREGSWSIRFRVDVERRQHDDEP